MNKHTPTQNHAHDVFGFGCGTLYSKNQCRSDMVFDGDVLSVVLMWGLLAALAWNLKELVSRFPYFFLGLQNTQIVLPTLYARAMIAGLASWQVLLIAADSENFLPPLCYLLLTGYWLYVGWNAEGDEHLDWLGVFACGTAIVIAWQGLSS
jgi:hypothetical protein